MWEWIHWLAFLPYWFRFRRSCEERQNKPRILRSHSHTRTEHPCLLWLHVLVICTRFGVASGSSWCRWCLCCTLSLDTHHYFLYINMYESLTYLQTQSHMEFVSIAHIAHACRFFSTHSVCKLRGYLPFRLIEFLPRYKSKDDHLQHEHTFGFPDPSYADWWCWRWYREEHTHTLAHTQQDRSVRRTIADWIAVAASAAQGRRRDQRRVDNDDDVFLTRTFGRLGGIVGGACAAVFCVRMHGSHRSRMCVHLHHVCVCGSVNALPGNNVLSPEPGILATRFVLTFTVHECIMLKHK